MINLLFILLSLNAEAAKVLYDCRSYRTMIQEEPNSDLVRQGCTVLCDSRKGCNLDHVTQDDILFVEITGSDRKVVTVDTAAKKAEFARLKLEEEKKISDADRLKELHSKLKQPNGELNAKETAEMLRLERGL